ncbi:TrkH family potassium uptake protein [Treponema pedis]|uniref:TrkH family potassium uptake protein n=1 Tax=Treponema pedis TaxID=409322 RepID=UPI00197EE498|nr:TrkH family potassium uptake protein [Treponema pedis]QSI03687.1 TrkH family potassium uptake protein [Treponema pedis]
MIKIVQNKLFQYVRIIFMILAIIAISFVMPVLTAIYKNENYVIPAFIIPALSVCSIAAFLFFIGKNKKIRLSTEGGIILVAAAWITACIFGALPLYFSKAIPGFIDSVFESVSGFSTTGGTVLTDAESCPISIHVWRCQMHWLGGMGIVALTVALFPLLGVGGFRLIKSETSGPDKGKVTAKITHTAKALWFIYLGMTVIQTALLMLAGLPFIEALCHTFATLGTGGFSTRNASIGSFNSPAVDFICAVFMLLAGVNFSLYFHLFTGHAEELFNNSELRAYLRIAFAATVLITVSIFPLYGFIGSLRHAFFQVASILTTTGFSTVNYDVWPEFSKLVLFALMFIGGCSGSTSGNIKVIRWLVLKKQAWIETERLLHPHGVFSIRLNKRPGRKDIVYSIAGFMFCYFFLGLVTAFVAVADGTDMLTGISAAFALIGNVGPGFGRVGPAGNFAFFSPAAKVFFSFVMLAGRLELYTMIIYFMPAFWKR